MAISKLSKKKGFQSFPSFTKGREGRKVEAIVIHHMATTNFSIVPSIWKTRQASAHYGIKDNSIKAYVDENNTAWAVGNWVWNTKTISIELCNSTGTPKWKVSDKTIQSCIKLCAEITKRRGWKKLVKNKNIYMHQHFQATACPGPYVKSKFDYIIKEANKLLTSKKVVKPTYVGRYLNKKQNRIIKFPIYAKDKKEKLTTDRGSEYLITINTSSSRVTRYNSNNKIIKGNNLKNGQKVICKIKKI